MKGTQDTLPFHPYYTMKDAFAIVVFLMFFAAWVVLQRRTIWATPINYHAGQPAARRRRTSCPNGISCRSTRSCAPFPDKLGGVIAMFGSILILFALPWLDTSTVRSGNYRPLFKGFFWIFVVVCIALGYLGSKPAEGAYVIWSRILTAYYFAHFLVILPLLGLLESPKPLPASISDSVIAKNKPAAVPAE